MVTPATPIWPVFGVVLDSGLLFKFDAFVTVIVNVLSNISHQIVEFVAVYDLVPRISVLLVTFPFWSMSVSFNIRMDGLMIFIHQPNYPPYFGLRLQHLLDSMIPSCCWWLGFELHAYWHPMLPYPQHQWVSAIS